MVLDIEFRALEFAGKFETVSKKILARNSGHKPWRTEVITAKFTHEFLLFLFFCAITNKCTII